MMAPFGFASDFWKNGSGDRELTLELPGERPLVAFFAVTQTNGARVSSEHIELPAR